MSTANDKWLEGHYDNEEGDSFDYKKVDDTTWNVSNASNAAMDGLWTTDPAKAGDSGMKFTEDGRTFYKM